MAKNKYVHTHWKLNRFLRVRQNDSRHLRECDFLIKLRLFLDFGLAVEVVTPKCAISNYILRK